MKTADEIRRRKGIIFPKFALEIAEELDSLTMERDKLSEDVKRLSEKVEKLRKRPLSEEEMQEVEDRCWPKDTKKQKRVNMLRKLSEAYNQEDADF